MERLAMATAVTLIPTLFVVSGPAMARHRAGGRAARGPAPGGHAMPHGHPGMPHFLVTSS
jgi:hypothetical protein